MEVGKMLKRMEDYDKYFRHIQARSDGLRKGAGCFGSVHKMHSFRYKFLYLTAFYAANYEGLNKA